MGTATLTDTNVYANQGGGILIDGSADLTDCSIHDNAASARGGGGGGLFILGTATLTNTNVYANQATNYYVCSPLTVLALSSSAPRS